MNLRDVGIRVSYQIKKKERGRPERKRKTPPFSLIPKIMLPSVLFISFSIEMQGKLFFLVERI